MKMLFCRAALILGAFACRAEACGQVGFDAAVPVWPKGFERTMNANFRFVSEFPAEESGRAVIRVTGANFFRLRLNGRYVGYGPARGPKGWFRVDEWPCELAAGTNRLEIEATAYNCSTYYTTMHPGFLQAEVVGARGRILSATGRGDDFTATDTERVTRVPRYSYQRGFSEVYRLGGVARPVRPLAVQPTVKLLPRRASYPAFALNENLRVLARGAMEPTAAVPKLQEFLAPAERRPDRIWYLKDEFEASVVPDVTGRVFVATSEAPAGFPVALSGTGAVQMDAGLNDCGFFGAAIEVRRPGRLVLAFDEVLTDGRVDPWRLDCCNAIEWIFERPGVYEIESLEPVVWRYANLFVAGGAELTVNRAYVRTYKNPDTGRATFRCSDPALERIFAAAKETFAQNAVDGFTDCPSRERAGWLCDSFFLGRVSQLLTGGVELERLFLENYSLPSGFDNLPAGMVPMCYPADHLNGEFIPNWAMWLVLEADEFLRRSGDRAFVDALRPTLEGVIAYLGNFENEEGILEQLRSWVFVEWSAANRLVQDVNYPSSMLWAETLDAMDRLYGRPDLAAKARKTRAAVRRRSWTGTWFCDNARYEPDDSVRLTGHCTETCQYYAFFFGTATRELYPELWKTLVGELGPRRLASDHSTPKTHKDLWPSNAFIGNYLRLECLSRAGLVQQLLDESKDYFLYMAERTGTLWEHNRTNASCNHGFASHVAVVLYRDVLGVREIDARNRRVRVEPPADINLDWCEGTIPVGKEKSVFVRWERGKKPVVRWMDGPRQQVVVRERTGEAIQHAIDQVSSSGGGRVVLTTGVYNSRSLQLKDGVELHLEKGAVLKGSSNGEDYSDLPDQRHRAGFIQAFGVRDVAVTGEGTVEIDGMAFFDTSKADLWEGFFHPWQGPRPEMVQFHRCKNVRLEGVTFLNSPLWTIHFRLCENVTMDGVTVRNDLRFINADGVDFDGCRHVVLRNSTFSTSDDCVVLRAVPEVGMDEVVTEDVLVENCDLESACQTIRIGCPSDGVIRNAVFRNLRGKGRNGIVFDNPTWYLSEKDDGRLLVENVRFDGYVGAFNECAIKMNVGSGVDIRGIRDVSYRNFDVKTTKPLVFVGNTRSPLERIVRENFRLNGELLADGAFAADCSDDAPLKRAEIQRISIARPRPGVTRQLANPARSY